MDMKFPKPYKKAITSPIDKENTPSTTVPQPIIYGQDRTIPQLFGEPEVKYPEPVIKQNTDNK